MKNFFKKLSFVLAIAMVLTSIAPATASAAEVVPAKKVNVKLDGEKVTSVDLDVEETKTVKIGLPVKKAYEGQKSTFKTWAEVADETVVDVNRVGNRKYELTGVAAGETTITITAAKTKKLAKAGEGVAATLTVVVNEKAAEVAATQTGAKEVTITGLEGAKDDMTVSLKKGNSTVNVTSVKAEDENTLVLTTTAKLQDADYTVKVDETTLEFTAEAEKLTFFEVTGDYAVVDNAIMTDSAKATVPYIAQNQFEEAMSGLNIQVNSSLGQAEAKNGMITITITTNTAKTLVEGQTHSVVMYCQELAKSTQKTVSVAASSKIKSISVDGIHSVKGYPFNEDCAFLDTFYLMLTAEDQYGYPVVDKAKAASDLLPISTNPLVAKLGAFDVVKVNGVSTLVIQITPVGAGSAEIRINPTFYTGVATYVAEVETGIKLDTITLYQPDGAYQGEKVNIPVEAYDVNGNLITDVDVLNRTVKDINVTGVDAGTVRFTKNYLTGDIFLTTPKVAADSATVTAVVTSATYKTSNILIYTKAAAVPTVIGGIDARVDLSVVTGETITIPFDKVIVYDQYDRKMNMADPNVQALFGTGKYQILAVSNAAVVGILGATTPWDAADTFEITPASSLTLAVTSGAIKTTTTGFNLYLNNDKVIPNSNPAKKFGPVLGSERDIVVSAVSFADLVRYEIDTVDKLFVSGNNSGAADDANHGKAFKVYGYTASGLKVPMPVSTWEIATGTTTSLFAVSQGDDYVATVAAIAAPTGYLDSVMNANEEIAHTVYVNIKHDNKIVSKTITACETNPVLTTFGANPYSTAVSVTGENELLIYAANVVSGDAIIAQLQYKDQYGVDVTPFAPVIVISDLSYGLEVTANGTSDPIISLNTTLPGAPTTTAGLSYTATVTAYGKTLTVNVILSE